MTFKTGVANKDTTEQSNIRYFGWQQAHTASRSAIQNGTCKVISTEHNTN